MITLMIVLSLSGVITSSILIIYLLRLNKGNKLANRLLALLFFFLTIRIGKATLYYYFDLDILAVYIGLTAFLAIGPTVYLYLNSVLNEKHQLAISDYVHFAPFILAFIVSLIIDSDTLSLLQPHLYNAILIYYLVYLVLGCYQFLSSDIHKRDLWKTKKRFLWNVVGAATLIYFVYAIDWFVGIDVYIYGGLFYTVIIYLFILKSLFDRNIYHKVGREKGYKHINEESIDLDELSQKIDRFFEEDKIYLDPELTIERFSNILRVSRHQLSEYINIKEEKSFPSFVNQYRLSNAKIQLLNTDKNISEIAYASGFNSISTFNTLFRKETGMTPSVFRQK